MITGIRYAQQLTADQSAVDAEACTDAAADADADTHTPSTAASTVTPLLPAVGMVVAADIGDPGGVNHPVHPPYKQEVARRLGVLGV